jgi:hypothetical protein
MAESRAHLKVRSNLAASAQQLVNMPAAKDQRPMTGTVTDGLALGTRGVK